MHERFSLSYWAVLTIAIAFIVCSVVLGGAIRNIKRTSDTITVTGSAKRGIRSDYIIWRGSINAQKSELQEAYREVNLYGNRVRTYLRDHHIPDSSITFSSIETEPIKEFVANVQPTGQILAYNLTQRFEVRSNQVDSIAALSRQATELIDEGIQLTSYPPEYLFTRLGDLRMEMLSEATKDARKRAETIAEAAGSRVGPVRTARMGVFQITQRYSTEVSDYGINDTWSLEKDITAVVSLSFALK